MEISIVKSKGEIIKEILFEKLNLIYFIMFNILLVIGLILVFNSIKIGVLLLYLALIYYIISIKRVISVLLIKTKSLNIKFYLDNYGLKITKNDSTIIVPYKSLVEIKEEENKTKIFTSKKSWFKYIYIPKKSIVKGNRNEFIENLKDKIENSENIKEYNSNYVLSFSSNFYKDLLRQMAREYRSVRLLVLILANLFFGLILIQSENGKIGGFILFGFALLLILKPIINVIESRNKGEGINHIVLKDNKLEIVNNGIFVFNISDLRIHKDKKEQIIIRSLKNKGFTIAISEDEIISGNFDALLDNLKYEDKVLNKSFLGVTSIILTTIAIISIPLVLYIGEITVIICITALFLSLIFALINIFKKNVYKKFAIISLVIYILIILLFIMAILINIEV